MKWMVYYRKDPTFREDKDLIVSQIPHTHVFVRCVDAKDREEVFHKMQGEVWSPYGEQREYIKSRGLKHTSMSVGDIAVAMHSGFPLYLQCASSGWEIIPFFRKPQVKNLGEITTWFIRVQDKEKEYVNRLRTYLTGWSDEEIISHVRTLVWQEVILTTGFTKDIILSEINRRCKQTWLQKHQVHPERW
jgi:hypothetical protein